jgi:polyhydroxyalkanoate synthesis regulator phasin
MAKAKNRQVSPLSLAFLDVMFCGFGAVILLFLILDHATTVAAVRVDPSIAAEVSLLEEEVLEGEINLERLRNTVADVSLEVVTAEGLAMEIQEQLQTFLEELAALENSSTATVESIEKLRADVRALEEELLRLQASALDQEGNSVRQFLGDGSRQYLTGLFLGGQRILVLVDSSTSMLDETLVNIIRTRNMNEERKLAAPKWQRVIRTVDWVSTQLPITSRYQLWHFNQTTESLLDAELDSWQEVAERDGLNAGIDRLKALVPNNGTDLQQVFRAIAAMDERPDNIFLITDGLPTLGERGSRTGLVTPKDRLDRFEDALDALPDNIPVNIVLLPLEGDPSASAAYWQLAQISRGSFITPSKDWP